MAIRLDLGGAGGGAGVRLWDVLERVSAVSDGDARSLPVAFDQADATWLRGYANLLEAMAEFWLAHDFRSTFDEAFPIVFPGAVGTALPATARSFEVEIAQAVAAVHSLRWPVAEPTRLLAVRAHLKATIALSRENWEQILAETDDHLEWIPSPRQKAAIPGLGVTEQQVEGWRVFLDQAEAVLDGRLLVPHWLWTERTDTGEAAGLDLKQMFEVPRTFDLVLLIAGRDALPYLRMGSVMGDRESRMLDELFAGRFLTYAIWFN